MNTNLFSSKNLTIWLHLLAWSILLFFPIYFGFDDIQRNSPFYVRMYVNSAGYVALFYLNYLWLVPKLFFTNKRVYYFAAIVVAIALLYYSLNALVELIYNNFPMDRHIEKLFYKLMQDNNIAKPAQGMHIYNHTLTSVLVTGFSLGLRTYGRLAQNEKQRKEMEQEKLNSELAFLKNQISPHFFFNTLNNIYSLMQISVPDAGASILKLSKLMRYLLYESESGLIPLAKEIEFMQNYIELMRLRLTPKVKLHVNFPTQALDLQVPPLLFIAFLENAFKHGVSNREVSEITVNFQAHPNRLHFTCKNTRFQRDANAEGAADSGIGLENIKKRLALLYPNSHELKISDNNTHFSVELIIHLVP